MPKKKKKAAPPPGCLAFVCDTHIDNHPRFGGPLVDGINDRGWQTLKTFERAVQKAVELKCVTLVVPGDLFHRNKPDPVIVAQLQKILRAAGNLGILLIPGNHDMSDATALGGNTAMAPLWEYATVVREPQWFTIGEFNLLAIPFDARGFMGKTIEEVLAMSAKLESYGSAPRDNLHVMSTHVGVWQTDQVEFWQARAKDGMNADDLLAALDATKARWAFVGNYHRYETWGVNKSQIIQVGTLCPASFGDEGLKDRGLMALLAPNKESHMIEIPGPRFIDTTETGLVKIPKAPKDYTYYVRQLGGDPPTTDPKDRGWYALTYTPDKTGKAVGTAPKETKLGIEETIVEGVKAHKSLATDEDRDAAAESALNIWRAVR